jgi:Domain of Unknown Function (DUF1259)
MVKNLVFRTTILLGLISNALAADLDTARIDQITGLKGKFNEKEGVYKVTFPRNDVKIIVDGWTMPPFMGLGTWAAVISITSNPRSRATSVARDAYYFFRLPYFIETPTPPQPGHGLLPWVTLSNPPTK